MTFDHTQRFGIGMLVKAFPPFLFDRLANCRDTVGSYPTISDSGEPVVKRTRQRKPTLAVPRDRRHCRRHFHPD